MWKLLVQNVALSAVLFDAVFLVSLLARGLPAQEDENGALLLCTRRRAVKNM